MQLGYYWARRGSTWRIVEVVQGLHGAVLENGYSVAVGEFDEIDPTPIVRRVSVRERVETMAAELEAMRFNRLEGAIGSDEKSGGSVF